MDKQLTQLEQVLQQQIEAHDRLLAALRQKLAALRQADQKQIIACCNEENTHFQQIARLEKQRLTLTAELTRITDPAARQPLRLGELAQRLSEPYRGRLLVLRHQLTTRIQSVQRETGAARQSAQMLVAHMHGLIQTVGAALTGLNIYGRGGNLPRAATAVSTFSAKA